MKSHLGVAREIPSDAWHRSRAAHPAGTALTTRRDRVELAATCLLGAATLAVLAYAVFGR